MPYPVLFNLQGVTIGSKVRTKGMPPVGIKREIRLMTAVNAPKSVDREWWRAYSRRNSHSKPLTVLEAGRSSYLRPASFLSVNYWYHGLFIRTTRSRLTIVKT